MEVLTLWDGINIERIVVLPPLIIKSNTNAEYIFIGVCIGQPADPDGESVRLLPPATSVSSEHMIDD